jgi:ribosome-binding factor A
MNSLRQQRVADFLRDEISEIIRREMRDPRLGFVSITRVEVSPDLRYAKVFASVYDSEEEQAATIDALNGATGFIRRLLKPRMRTRHIPELTFRLDRSMEYAEQVTRTLNMLREQLHPEAAAEPGDPDEQAR